jgi:hypothetical protein
MSTIVCLKENGSLVLATDSIVYDASKTRVLSCEERKIFEFFPNAFYAAVGFCGLAEAQVRILAALARSAQTIDLGALADMLDSASWPIIEQLAKGPDAEQLQDEAGVRRLHGYILAGLNEGVPGYLFREFSIRNDGTVCREEQRDFHPVTAAGVITPGHLATDLNIAEMWPDGLIPTTERILDHLRRATKFIGGPVQMVCIDKSGARWVHQPIQNDLTERVAPNLGGALQINPTTKAIEVTNIDITRFASSVRPVALFASNPSLPSANYPAGTYGFNTTTHSFLRVGDPGNAWVAAVNGGSDIQAGTITADRLVVSDVVAAMVTAGLVTTSYLSANYITASAIAATYVTSTYLSANYVTSSYLSANYITSSAIAATYITASAVAASYATFSYLSSNYATIGALNAKTITADKITGGTCTASVSFSSPSITGGSLQIVASSGATVYISSSYQGMRVQYGSYYTECRYSDIVVNVPSNHAQIYTNSFEVTDNGTYSHLGSQYLTLSGAQVINSSSQFVGSGGVNTGGSVYAGSGYSGGAFAGSGVSCPYNGIGGSGFSVYFSGGWNYGASFYFYDRDGGYHRVLGGIVVF